MARELTQLPNKDFWYGYSENGNMQNNILDAEVVPETAQNPVNKAMAQILQSSKGAQFLTCLWCGTQGDEKTMRAHLKESHPAVVNPTGQAEAALATLATAQKPVIEAQFKKD